MLTGGRKSENLFLEYFMEDLLQLAILEKQLLNASAISLELVKLMLSSIIVDRTADVDVEIILFIPFQVFF